MNRLLSAMAVFLMTLFMNSGCVPVASPPLTSSLPRTTIPVATKSAWQEEWEKTVAAAKQEGRLSIASSLGAEVLGSVSAGFKEKYGIGIEVLGGRATEHMTRIAAERRAGLYTVDIIMGGATEMSSLPDGTLESVEKAFILPEVKDVNAWRDKSFPFYDKEGKIFMYFFRVGPAIMINTDLVKREEIKSWRDLLESKWKGKMLLEDPTVIGAGSTVITAVGEIMGIDFLKELAKQEPVINRDKRLQVEWVARGKYPLAIAYNLEIMEEFRGQGAPVAPVVPKEGIYVGAGVGCIGMLDRAPDPNVAKVFINWFLSREGQTLATKAAIDQSRRVDIVPVLPPDRLGEEGIKYINIDNEYMVNKKNEMRKLSTEIFGLQYR